MPRKRNHCAMYLALPAYLFCNPYESYYFSGPTLPVLRLLRPLPVCLSLFQLSLGHLIR